MGDVQGVRGRVDGHTAACRWLSDKQEGLQADAGRGEKWALSRRWASMKGSGQTTGITFGDGVKEKAEEAVVGWQ